VIIVLGQGTPILDAPHFRDAPIWDMTNYMPGERARHARSMKTYAKNSDDMKREKK